MFQMTPTHISVQRCEGGCHQASHGCVATRTREKKVAVMFGKCGLSVGKCEKECAHVSVEEHTECGCACALKAEDCASAVHRFLPELCSCECRDTRARRECQDQGRTWSHHSCECGCPLALITQCPTGYTYNYNTSCSCESTYSASTYTPTILEQEITVISWEIMIIITLVSILILLSLITMMLVIRLKTMRKSVNSNHSLVPSTLSGQYFPCTAPCSDLVGQRKKGRDLPSLSGSESEPCREHLTDSSLCSETEKDHWNQMSEGSSESLATVRQNKILSENCQQALRQSDQCLESVRLNRNLAIRSRVGDSPSNYNTVKIVYKNGERTMELNCQMEPSQSELVNITSNLLAYSM